MGGRGGFRFYPYQRKNTLLKVPYKKERFSLDYPIPPHLVIASPPLTLLKAKRREPFLLTELPPMVLIQVIIGKLASG